MWPGLYTEHESNWKQSLSKWAHSPPREDEVYESVHKTADVRCEIEEKAVTTQSNQNLRTRKRLTSENVLRIDTGHIIPARSLVSTKLLGCPSLSITKMLKDTRESVRCVFFFCKLRTNRRHARRCVTNRARATTTVTSLVVLVLARVRDEKRETS